MSNLVSDSMVESALLYLSQNTQASAKAKADRVMAEHMRRVVRAQMVMESTQTTAGLREADAESSVAYRNAILAEREAVEADEYHRAARSKAEAIIEAWRTESATIRAAERIR